MNMNRLWAPWRIKYINIKKDSGCVFCRAAKSPQKNFVIFKTNFSISMLNIYPYNNGHMMISPLRHVARIQKLKDKEILDLIKTLNKTQELLDRVVKPHGYNIGINVSEIAGAGITGHLHIHLVPRWRGDTNFMPVIPGIKVISESLDELYKRLKNAGPKTD